MAVAEGVPVDGYVHWSLTDNFEWAEGFRPRFGLYAVDRATYARTPTAAVDVYRRIIADGGLRESTLADDGDHLSPGE